MSRGNGTHAPATKLLLIGWDGATPEVLERLIAAGRLPNVQRLIDRGTYRRLASTIPPVTACAWSSFLSGKNPGKHGLFEFVTPRAGSYRFDYTHGGHRRDKNSDLLALLNIFGYAVGCVNVPMTYPPRPVRGFMISGLDAPDEKAGIAAPADAFEAVQKALGSAYRIDNRHLGHMKTDDDRAAALAEFDRIETLRTDVTFGMMERIPVDVACIVYNATDQAQHHFWHLMDERHPQHPGSDAPDVQRFRRAIDDIYAHCDVELGRWLDRFPDADAMLMSDHGQGGTNGPCVRINNILAEAGLLTWASEKGSAVAAVVGRLDAFLRRTLTARQKAMLARLLPTGRTMIESMGLPPIDWARTTAFCYEGFTLAPSIWINRKGLFPQGSVESGEAYEQALRRVTNVLEQIRDPQTGEPVIPAIHRADEIYHGPYVAAAPDLTLDWWTGRTFTLDRSHPRFANQPHVYYPDEPIVPGRDISGIHRMHGVFAAAGPHLAQRGMELEAAASLIDIAPTVLSLLGVSVPPDMDGRVLEELIAERIEGRSADHAGAAGMEEDVVEAYSDAERRKIEERLSGLGYL